MDRKHISTQRETYLDLDIIRRSQPTQYIYEYLTNISADVSLRCLRRTRRTHKQLVLLHYERMRVYKGAITRISFGLKATHSHCKLKSVFLSISLPPLSFH
jgi:hypothetical protein